MAHSVWLVPEGALHARLAGVIAELARRHGTTPFQPHVTLLGGIEAPEDSTLSAARQLAARLPPVELRLGEVRIGADFFHCVYVAVDATPELLAARALAGRVLGGAPGPPFHLSLVYGRLGDAAKQAARAAAGDLRSSFTVDALLLMDTTGDDAASWRCLDRIPLATR